MIALGVLLVITNNLRLWTWFNKQTISSSFNEGIDKVVR